MATEQALLKPHGHIDSAPSVRWGRLSLLSVLPGTFSAAGLILFWLLPMRGAPWLLLYVGLCLLGLSVLSAAVVIAVLLRTNPPARPFQKAILVASMILMLPGAALLALLLIGLLQG